jgi:hypothetical protein
MQMHFKQSDSTEIVDALEFALMVINADVADARIGGMVVTRAVETLQVLRSTFGIAAAKEQRKGRANNDATTSCKVNHQHLPSCDQPI